MNDYIRAGQCPFCLGHGWVPVNRPDDGVDEPCEACCGTGSLAEMWEHRAEARRTE